MVTWAVEATARALRRHGGLGGSGAANLLEKAPAGVDFWWLALCEDRLFLAAYRRGAEQPEGILRSCAFFDRLPFAMCNCCARGGEPVLMVSLGEGVDVPVRARTRVDAGRAAGLVQVAARRGLPSLGQDEHPVGVVDLPLRDADLVTILRDFYGDTPQVVAAAIRALRRAGCKGHEWVTRTLAGHAVLRGLAARVQAELAGHATGNDLPPVRPRRPDDQDHVTVLLVRPRGVRGLTALTRRA
jgi:hypothetical protein